MKPVFQHDCQVCTYLATVVDDDRVYDLYVHTHPHATVIARYGSAGHEYRSGIGFAEDDTRAGRITPLRIALELAVERYPIAGCLRSQQEDAGPTWVQAADAAEPVQR